jgi:hypothetical protein
MQILDGKRHDRLAERSHVARVAYFLNGGGHWGRLDLSEMYSLEERQQADTEFRATLRALVNQWIDSGKGPDGIDEPQKRDLFKVPPGYTERLYDVLLVWLGRNLPQPVLMGTGKIGIIDQPPSLLALDANKLSRHRSLSELKVYARDCALYHFKDLLDSPSALCLTRCSNPKCTAPYYVRARVRTKEIKRGAYCGKCTGVGSAERVRASRTARKRELIEHAAGFWNKWKPKRQFGSRSKWVASQMNMGLTGRWVSQHRAEIEAEVGRRKTKRP